MRPAVTMLELVFVIVILGIVSSIGAEIVAQVYESYIVQRASSRSGIKTELAATQLANRLTYAIPGTIIGRKGATFRPVDHLDSNDYTILQWIAYDDDSFSAYRKPSWSGLADLKNCTSTTISTPGSVIDKSDNIIKNLKGAGLSDAILLFPGEFSADTLGYKNSTGATDVIAVTGGSGETLNVSDMTGKTINEHYKLAWTSYAVVPVANTNGSYDLELRYNFQPWTGNSSEFYDTTTNKQILLRNVTVFQFTSTASTLRFKICQQEKIVNSFITTCKEKAVIR